MNELEFPDDDLDISDDTFLELEQHAITSTQKQPVNKPPPSTKPLARSRQAHNASSLTRNKSGYTNIPWRPPQRQGSFTKPSQNVSRQSSQSFEDGENVVNLAADEAIPWSQSQQPLQTRPKSRSLHKPIDDETAAIFAAADAELARQNESNDSATLRADSIDDGRIAALQARIAELEAVSHQAEEAAEKSRKALEAKNGEITIVRSNLERERKEHDKRIAALTRSHAEEAAKHKAELDVGRKEREKMQTDNQFLKHDLAQEVGRVKRLHGPVKTRSVALSSRGTPKRIQKHGLGDGFDDDGMIGISPSRSRGSNTPKLGEKRKRDVQDSPVEGISFSKPTVAKEESVDEPAPKSPAPDASALLDFDDVANDGRITFMQNLLNYSLGDVTVLERLAQLRPPSDSSKALSSILMAGLDSLGTQPLPVQLAKVMLRIWSMCLKEQFWEPLPIVVDLLRFAMRNERLSCFAGLAEEIVPLCLNSLEIVTMPVVRGHLNSAYLDTVDKDAQQKLAQKIDAHKIAVLLHKICQACELEGEDRLEAFWQRFDFTNSMLLIHKALPIERAMMGMEMLATSALHQSFGAISETQENQAQWERDSIYRLTFAFFDSPILSQNEEAFIGLELAKFKSTVLRVFVRLCETDRGSQMLADHPHFIGRLVKFLDEQVTRLYALPPFMEELKYHADFDLMGSDDGEIDEEDLAERAEHDLVAETINTAVRMLHHLLTAHEDSIDLSARFAVVTGGYHRFLISMTRIAFVEQPSLFEYGIDEEVIDAAHSILDAFLTPEDGEAIAQALDTPEASRGTYQQNQNEEDDGLHDGEAMEVED